MGDDVEAMMMKGGNMVQVIFWQVYFLILLLIFALILWFQACSNSDKHALVTPWLKGDILGEKLVTLADHLCNKDLESTVSSESYFSERWSLLSLVLSQHVKNGR